MSINTILSNGVILADLATAIGPYLPPDQGIRTLSSPDSNIVPVVSGTNGALSLANTLNVNTLINTPLLNASNRLLLNGSPGTTGQTILSQSVGGPTVWGQVPTAGIADGSITDAKINTSAGIELSKLQTISPGQIIVGSSGGVPTAVAMSGGATISPTGVVTLNAGSTALTNNHIFVGNGSNVATDVPMTGDVNIINTGATNLNPAIYSIAQVTIPAANVQNLNTSGWTILLPQANICYNILRFDYGMQVSSTQFTFPANTQLSLQYITDGQPICNVDAAFMNNSIIGQYTFIATPTLADVSSTTTLTGNGINALTYNNTGVQIRTSANSLGPGGNDLVIRITFQQVPYLL